MVLSLKEQIVADRLDLRDSIVGNSRSILKGVLFCREDKANNKA